MNSNVNSLVPSAQQDLYRVVARSDGAGVGLVAAKDTEVRFDRSWGAGPSGLPGPAELLCSAFAACVVKNVERFSQMLPLRYKSVEIEVEAHRHDRPARFDRLSYEVRIVTDEAEARVDLLARNLIKHGTVFNTLAAGCDITGQVIAVAPGQETSQSQPTAK